MVDQVVQILFNGYFSSLPGDETYFLNPENRLWRACLDIALREYALGPRWRKGVENRITPKMYNDVAKWLSKENPDFREVCALANLDEDIVFETFIKLGDLLDGQE